MSMTPALRAAVHSRAGGCCEFCRLSAMSGTVPFHVDHIVPRKHGGTDSLANLCLACFNCNTYKGHDLTGIDPLTDEITPLFNPRRQVWKAHFTLQPTMHVIGLTPIGRTTVRVLQMNLEERVESRWALAEISEYPCAESSSMS